MDTKKASRLFAIWIAAFIVFSIVASILASNYSCKDHLAERDLPELIKLAFSVVLLVAFCPPLLVIHNYATLEQNFKIKRRTLFLFLTIAIAALGTIVTIILG